MKFNFLYIILAAFLVIFAFWLYAQVDHTYKILESQIGSHTERLEVLEIPPQTGEDEEKIKLRTQLADANTKLISADFDKMKLELKESNQQWLWGWTAFLGVMFAVFGIALWFFVKSLIEDRVEERLNGFKESVDKVSVLEGQLNILKKEHAVSILDSYQSFVLRNIESHSERVKALSEDVLLKVFDDKTRDLEIRWTAIAVLAARESPQLVSPVLKFLNYAVDLNVDLGKSYGSQYQYLFLASLSKIPNAETYQGIKNFLNRLITENPKNKDLFLTWTVYSLAKISIKLDIRNSKDMLRKVVPDLKDSEHKGVVLDVLIEYFEKSNGQEGIKDILTNDLTDNLPDREEKCLEFMQDHDPDFVREWKERKENTKTQGENTDETESTK